MVESDSAPLFCVVFRAGCGPGWGPWCGPGWGKDADAFEGGFLGANLRAATAQISGPLRRTVVIAINARPISQVKESCSYPKAV